MKIRIYYEDTDAGGIVYHTNYIKYCERARSEAFFEAGLNFTKEGGYFVVSALEAKFLASAVLGDEVFVRTLAFMKDGRLAKIDESMKAFISEVKF